MRMNKVELKDMLNAHKEWLADNSKGKRIVLDNYTDLSYADLSYADLRYADLSYTDLSSANFRSANLRSANLSSADLSYTDLSSANFRSANLRSANLSEIKKDFFERLFLAKNEAAGLYDFIQKGKVDGQSYEDPCACFVGTIANIKKENYRALSCGLLPDANSPTERWFLAILIGDTPQSNQASKITCEWISEFCKENDIVLPEYKIVSSDECPDAFK